MMFLILSRFLTIFRRIFLGLFFILIFLLNVHVDAKPLSYLEVSYDDGQLSITIEVPDGWHTYYKDPGDVGTPLTINWTLPEGVTVGDIIWPEPEEFDTFGLVNRGYHDDVTLHIPVFFDETSFFDHRNIHGEAMWLVCKDTCIPQSQSFDVSFGDEDGGEEVLLWILLYAFLGGLILNVMPCVLPVLSLKALEVVQSSAEDNYTLRRHAWAYTSGIVVTFLALSLVLIGLRLLGYGLGWGFQLQSPTFVGTLIVLMLGIALYLLDVLPMPLWLLRVCSVDTSQANRSSFMTGVLATIVATPCTAPFMATALGVALTLPIWAGLVVFGVLGLGMAFPFLLISYVPFFHKWLPKPGAWMVTFKKVLSIPMFATVMWLCWVFYSQVSVATVDMTTEIVFDPIVIENYLAEGRPVFVDVTAQWCLTCKVNEKGVLNSKAFDAWVRDNDVVVLTVDWTRYAPSITEYLESFGRNGVPLYVYYAPGKEPIVLPQLLTMKVFKNL